MTFVLSERQRETLRAVCDALLPSIDRSDDPEGYFARGALASGTPARGNISSDSDGCGAKRRRQMTGTQKGFAESWRRSGARR